MKEGTVPYNELIRNISNSSGYHIYEVKDVMNHFIAHTQRLLAEGNRVKLPGIGVINLHKMQVERVLNAEKICYTTCRLSLSTDEPMMRYLKENYLATDSAEERVAFPSE